MKVLPEVTYITSVVLPEVTYIASVGEFFTAIDYMGRSFIVLFISLIIGIFLIAGYYIKVGHFTWIL
jgi:hypothetical protein